MQKAAQWHQVLVDRGPTRSVDDPPEALPQRAALQLQDIIPHSFSASRLGHETLDQSR